MTKKATSIFVVCYISYKLNTDFEKYIDSVYAELWHSPNEINKQRAEGYTTIIHLGNNRSITVTNVMTKVDKKNEAH